VQVVFFEGFGGFFRRVISWPQMQPVVPLKQILEIQCPTIFTIQKTVSALVYLTYKVSALLYLLHKVSALVNLLYKVTI
jgi:hypothetical protein